MDPCSRISWLGVFVVLLSSCHISGPDEAISDISQIRSGTSFGFCVGYCLTELVIEPKRSIMTRKSWGRGGPEVPDQFLELETSQDVWRKLSELVEFEVITQMNDVYGCPDCADGGSEWIEITRSGRVKRVTFEYNAVLEPISELVDSLRSLRSSYLEILNLD